MIKDPQNQNYKDLHEKGQDIKLEECKNEMRNWTSFMIHKRFIILEVTQALDDWMSGFCTWSNSKQNLHIF